MTRLHGPDPSTLRAEVGRRGTPLVDPDPLGDPRHRAVTFVHFDDRADTVVLHANKFTDYSALDKFTLTRTPGTDVRHATYRLRADWRCSYTFSTHDGPLPDRRTMLRAARPDPFNRTPLRFHHTGRTVSIAELDEAPPRRWVDGPPPDPHRLDTPHPVWVHGPPRPVGPVLVLLDGDMWAEEHPIAPTLDALIVQGALPRLTTLLIGTSGARERHLTGDPDYADFVRSTVDKITVDSPAADSRVTIAGQSFGGLAAVHAALRHPDRFGTVIAQSGSFWWPDFSPRPAPPLRFLFQVGTQEWGMPPITRALAATLADQGHTTSVHEYNAGHDRAYWQGALIDALTAGAVT
ncbi:enterochelin esterase [Saccharothrix violaceirubra]